VKTSDLVTALVADQGTLEPRLGLRLAQALAAGAGLAVLVFALAVGPRPDWRLAVETVRFLFKFVPTILLAIAGIGALLRLTRPGAQLGVWAWLLAATVLIQLGAVGVELMVVPEADWARRAIGTNHWHCLALTPVLSIAPLAAALIAARHGATTRPALTGAVAGLAAAGIGATLYAMNCTDDSPLFVGIWYPLATAIVAGVGAAIGRRVLAW
jgi:hypothetical protein